MLQEKKSACGIRASLKKLSFYIKNGFYNEKRILWRKRKSACGIRPCLKNGVLTFKTHFTFKNAFYKKKKAPAALGPALRNAVLHLESHYITRPRP
jgi:hypothetical protein